ncbi:MAG: alpha/beta fold hydrolase [Xanthomonadales bacterium]|jgi:dipeptidyl aminopeptidase/acylaminoacyl peptidase|nr:alpha/beta fold hydrolase [Xanthomonadales bacterium]MDH3925902.1 alpha/beta fold hydrolase [Xanthomonadales bacterium]MDH3939622.1 alpha/beta fold hydrolase [Xanthomonadales bacterium]MDH4001961.1 alpha/beta fold hydrolase [Xanthomonadales bacterium]
MNKKLIIAGCLALCVFIPLAQAEVVRREANNGNLVMEDIPEIPQAVVAELNRYQNVRSAGFQGWTEDGEGIYVTTRFGDVSQIHHVGIPGGARTQLTFFDEPAGGVVRQPGGNQLIFTMDAGGSEFSQIFLLDPSGTDDARMLTDGESRNGAVIWDRRGEFIAYQSTRRNGASNDVWMMNASNPETAGIILESPDGTWWGPSDFSPDNQRLLITNYVGNADSRIHLLDLRTKELRLLAGNPATPSSNFALSFDPQGTGFFYITDVNGEFQQLAWQSLEEGSAPQMITADIPWHVEGGAVSDDLTRAAFTVNNNGFSQLYLFDMNSHEFRQVDVIPTGLVGGLEFSPDGSKLGMTLNTSQTPSDSFVLGLGEGALEFTELTRWTYSEVGGLDTSTFIQPELVSFPTFDSGEGGPDSIPAWVYKPAGEGPHPVVIVIHGGPEAQARPAFSSTYQLWLHKLGAAVIRPNVRGSDGYGKHYMSLDNGFKREDSVKDIGALLDWIATQPDLDENRVAVFGGSYGGYMVLASAVHYSDRLKAAVDIVGISNFVTFLENTQDYRRDLRRAEYGDERDPAMRKHLESISPLNHVDKIKVPMLVVQGENDPRVPVTEAVQIVEALRAQGLPVWYMNALNEGHGYRKKENRDIYTQATMMFLQEHL